MHRYKTLAQTLLVLSILNLVSAAPLLSRRMRNTGSDVVVGADNMTTVSDRRRGEQPPEGTTPAPQGPPSFPEGSPPHDPSTSDHGALLEGSESSSESHWSGTEGQIPVLEQTTERTPTSAHPLSTVGGPAPAPVPNTEVSTSTSSPPTNNRPGSAALDSTAAESTTSRPQYFQVTHDMLNRDPPSKKKLALKRIAGLTIMGGVVASIILLSEFYKQND